MADVACFCGCCFSFEGGAGACPGCGEVASLTGGSGAEGPARGGSVLDMNAIWQTGRPAGTGQDLDEALALSGLDVLAGHATASSTERR